MLPRAQRLTTATFHTAFQQGRVLRHPLLQLRVWPRGDGDNITRAAFVVAKKQGNAVYRNRLRRRMREAYRHRRADKDLIGCDLIFLAAAPTAKATSLELAQAVSQLLQRAARQIRV